MKIKEMSNYTSHYYRDLIFRLSDVHVAAADIKSEARDEFGITGSVTRGKPTLSWQSITLPATVYYRSYNSQLLKDNSWPRPCTEGMSYLEHLSADAVQDTLSPCYPKRYSLQG